VLLDAKTVDRLAITLPSTPQLRTAWSRDSALCTAPACRPPAATRLDHQRAAGRPARKRIATRRHKTCRDGDVRCKKFLAVVFEQKHVLRTSDHAVALHLTRCMLGDTT
jgi:hypothetical protein